MDSLKTLTPLGGTLPRRDEFQGLVISENADLAMASVAARAGSAKRLTDAFGAFAGCALADVECIERGDMFGNFWTGPDQWMVTAPFATHENLAADLKSSLGDAASVVEQTDGWCRFDLSGAAASAVLERLSAVDSRRMPADRAKRTQIEHHGCFLLCNRAGEDFSVLGPRSSARSLHHALTAAAISAV